MTNGSDLPARGPHRLLDAKGGSAGRSAGGRLTSSVLEPDLPRDRAGVGEAHIFAPPGQEGEVGEDARRRVLPAFGANNLDGGQQRQQSSQLQLIRPKTFSLQLTTPLSPPTFPGYPLNGHWLNGELASWVTTEPTAIDGSLLNQLNSREANTRHAPLATHKGQTNGATFH